MSHRNHWPSPACIAPAEIQAGDLVAYIEGAASPAVVRHIRCCSACFTEVIALGQMEQWLGQALGQAKQPVALGSSLNDVPRHSNGQVPQPQKGLNLLFPQGQGSFLSIALTFVAIFILVGLATSTYYLFGPGRHLSSVQPEAGLKASATLVKELAEVTTEVISGAAVPDVNQQMIAQYTVVDPPPQVIVEALVDIMRETTTPDFDRQLMTELAVVEAAPVGYGLDEEHFEVAPPLELRRILQREFRERIGS